MTQEKFYHSQAWRRLSRAFLMSRNYICEVCGKPAEIAHHKQHITPENIGNSAVTLNVDNLQALCIPCHNTIHYSTGGAIVKGLCFDENGDLRKKGFPHELHL
jgi:5-methylcytosine-specific restriction endonuclease McrA